MIISEKLSINQTLYVELDSISFSYQKSNIQNIKSVSLGKEKILVPNLCDAIKKSNCSDLILTSQVYIFLIIKNPFTWELINTHRLTKILTQLKN